MYPTSSPLANAMRPENALYAIYQSSGITIYGNEESNLLLPD